MTALVPQQTSMLPDAEETDRYWKLAQRVAGTDMVPSAYRGNADAVLAVAIAGRELGLGPMEALRSFDVIHGKPAPSAQLCHTLALRAGHDIFVTETTDVRAVVRCRRSDWPEDRFLDVDFTMDDAKKAGLDGQSTWKKYPRAMLRNRAITEAIRAVCPDVLVGATYTAEELGAEDTGPDGRVDDGEWVDQVSDVVVIPRKRGSTEAEDAAATAETEPLEDVVDAELVDEDVCTDCGAIGDDCDCDDDPHAAQRSDEFDTVLGKFPEAFVDWLDSDGRLAKARGLATQSDDGLVRAEARVTELHDWWTSQPQGGAA